MALLLMLTIPGLGRAHHEHVLNGKRENADVRHSSSYFVAWHDLECLDDTLAYA